MNSMFRLTVLGCFFMLGISSLPLVAAESLGIQLWSVRDQAKADVDKALDLVSGWEFKNVETAGTFGLTAEAFGEKLKQHKLKPVSAHYGYEQLGADLRGVIAEAMALGLKYVRLPILLPHTPEFVSHNPHDC